VADAGASDFYTRLGKRGEVPAAWIDAFALSLPLICDCFLKSRIEFRSGNVVAKKWTKSILGVYLSFVGLVDLFQEVACEQRQPAPVFFGASQVRADCQG
jgi:hypothetical protein